MTGAFCTCEDYYDIQYAQARNRIQQRENRKVTFRVGGDKHIQVVAKIKAVSGRIPANIAVGLGKETVTGTIHDPFFGTVTDRVLLFPGGSDNRCPVAGDGKI